MEKLIITAEDKESLYRELLPQIASLIAGETDLIANMANTAAALMEAFGFLWVGVYLVKPVHDEGGSTGENLVLGPFQGPLACTRIPYGRGVCGSAWKERKTLIVPDVDAFPGHIACSSLSRSEIVVPLFAGGSSGKVDEGRVVGVLDIDSREPGTFDETDRKYLEEIAALFAK